MVAAGYSLCTPVRTYHQRRPMLHASPSFPLIYIYIIFHFSLAFCIPSGLPPDPSSLNLRNRQPLPSSPLSTFFLALVHLFFSIYLAVAAGRGQWGGSGGSGGWGVSLPSTPLLLPGLLLICLLHTPHAPYAFYPTCNIHIATALTPAPCCTPIIYPTHLYLYEESFAFLPHCLPCPIAPCTGTWEVVVGDRRRKGRLWGTVAGLSFSPLHLTLSLHSSNNFLSTFPLFLFLLFAFLRHVFPTSYLNFDIVCDMTMGILAWACGVAWGWLFVLLPFSFPFFLLFLAFDLWQAVACAIFVAGKLDWVYSSR